LGRNANRDIKTKNYRGKIQMTADEQIANMTKAINEAIKVMGNRLGATETDVAKTIQMLKNSLLKEPPPAVQKLEAV
jgi:hypothetical protein